MEARAGNSILDFETLVSDFQELLNGRGLRNSFETQKSVENECGQRVSMACLGASADCNGEGTDDLIEITI